MLNNIADYGALMVLIEVTFLVIVTVLNERG